MKFIDFFAGIGGFHSGMELAGHECVGYVEWDRYARQSYESIYKTEGMYTANDIQQIKNGNELPQADVWCFGSPCTNISIAGDRTGLHGGASSMFFEVMRLLQDKEEVHRPAFLFMENVRNLLSCNKGWDFATVLYQMEQAGYDVEWQVINSKEVIPQNRDRIFVVGHKRGVKTGKVFPIDVRDYHTKYRILADVLEKDVDDKYILNDKKQELFRKRFKQNASDSDIKVVSNVRTGSGLGTKSRVYSDEGICSTLTASDYKEPKNVVQIANIGNINNFGGNPQTGRVYDIDGLSPTLNTMQGGGREPKIAIVNGTKQGYSEASYGDGVDLAYPKSKTRRGRVQPKRSNTLTANPNQGVVDRDNKVQVDDLVVRKLTPLECWRLQGFTDEQFYKAKNSGVSDSQLYKQAGNAVTVPVIHAIADKLWIGDD